MDVTLPLEGSASRTRPGRGLILEERRARGARRPWLGVGACDEGGEECYCSSLPGARKVREAGLFVS